MQLTARQTRFSRKGVNFPCSNFGLALEDDSLDPFLVYVITVMQNALKKNPV